MWEGGVGNGGSCVDSTGGVDPWCWEGVGGERKVVEKKGEAKVRMPWL